MLERNLSGSIFLRAGDQLVEMREQAWQAEERLQELLALYPNLLAGDQMNELAPRSWLLISREFGIPGELDAAGRWAVDHLFLDQDSIPTLVEVKRSTDTRIRREVVGQMLDYASHFTTGVSSERVRQRFETSFVGDAEDSAVAALRRSFGEDIDVEGYWERLGDNIAAGKLRLVFVADEFPPEMRRIVDFLNRQMQRTDVFAVEVRQFVSPDGHQTLVPRLLGKVESKSPSGTPAVRWDRQRFAGLLSEAHSDLVEVAEELRRFAVEVTKREVEWGTGRDRGSFTARLISAGRRYSLFSVYTTGQVSVNLGWSYQPLALVAPDLSEEVRNRVEEVFSVELSVTTWQRGWPMLPLQAVSNKLDSFKDLIRSCAKQVELTSQTDLPA